MSIIRLTPTTMVAKTRFTPETTGITLRAQGRGEGVPVAVMMA